jgi:hypothetical protein
MDASVLLIKAIGGGWDVSKLPQLSGNQPPQIFIAVSGIGRSGTVETNVTLNLTAHDGHERPVRSNSRE